jgi:hypothetical protein
MEVLNDEHYNINEACFNDLMMINNPNLLYISINNQAVMQAPNYNNDNGEAYYQICYYAKILYNLESQFRII